MVNFTVTRSSLQMQCLNQVLKAERPDIDQKRSDLLKLQGEFQLRLRHLEKDLLQVRVCDFVLGPFTNDVSSEGVGRNSDQRKDLGKNC